MLGVVVRVLLITVLPLSLGMYLRSRSPERVAEIEPRVKRIALIVFVGVVIGAIVAENERVLDNLDDVALAAITLNLAAMAISFSIARVARLDDRQIDRDRDRARASTTPRSRSRSAPRSRPC